MPSSFLHRIGRLAIIGVLVLLSACSATRLAYNNAPQFAWWWLDGYVDFPSEQVPRAKETLATWFAWHRQTQLADYAEWLQSVEQRAGEPVTAAQVCGWYAQARLKAQPAIDRALVMAVDLVPGLGAAQIAHLEQRYAKSNAEIRLEYLQGEPAERRKAQIKRLTANAERLWGRLEEPQRRIIEASQASSPFDAQRWLTDRERRQREIVTTLRRWQAQRPARSEMLAGVKWLAEQSERSPDLAHRAYQQRLTEHNCRVTADLHNSASPAQRTAARKQLLEWAEDLRALAAERAAP